MPNYSAETIKKKGDNRHTADLYPCAEIWAQDQAQTSNSRADGNRSWWLLIRLAFGWWCGAEEPSDSFPKLCTASSHEPPAELLSRVSPAVFSILGHARGAAPLQVPLWKGNRLRTQLWARLVFRELNTQVFRARVQQGHPKVLPLASLTLHRQGHFPSCGSSWLRHLARGRERCPCHCQQQRMAKKWKDASLCGCKR